MSDRIREIMQQRTNDLINTFGADWVADVADVDRVTVRVWAHRGRIGAKAAHLIGQHQDAINQGFVREYLRPDVKTWYL
jgi:hypothetical protein